MILRLFRPTLQDRIIASLYGTIVAQARAPVFYRGYGVPDTVNGRFEMITLHCVLLLRHLAKRSRTHRDLGQRLFDRFCTDMDDSMREMGVGDLTVPRKMRRIGEAFYNRQRAYGAALACSHDDVLAQMLERNVFAGAQSGEGARRLAAYVRAADSRLELQESLEQERPDFPDPGQLGVDRSIR
jgi:cytochrome b pre-mRNA-processing protein 3